MRVHSRRGSLAQTLGAGFFGATVMEQAVLRAAQARAQSAALVRYSSEFPRESPAEALAEAVQDNVASTYRALEKT